MIESSSVRYEQRLIYIALFTCLVISLFWNLDTRPLFLEEPRRALIALEMIQHDNLLVPTEFGELYHKKPPLWNWVLIASFKIFGGYTEWAVRFFSALSFIGMGILLFFISRRYISEKFAFLNTLLFMVSADIYFHFSQTGEIDLFYSFITFSAIASVPWLYDSNQRLTMFMVYYGLHALGFLTKGFPSVAFAGLSLPVFLFLRKDLRTLLDWRHFMGILLFMLITGVYFYAYNQYESAETFLKTLWSRSSDRTLAEHTEVTDVIGHIISFPVDSLKNILPASLLLPFLFQRRMISEIRKHPFVMYCGLVFMINYAVYLVSPGARQRYVYMLYPFLTTVLFYAWHVSGKHAFLVHKLIRMSVLALIILSTLCVLCLPFIPNLDFIPNKATGAGFLFALCLIVIYGQVKKKFSSMISVICLFIMARFGIDILYNPAMAAKSWSQQCKDEAQKIRSFTKNEPIYFMTKSISQNTVFYIARESEQTIKFKEIPESGDFYIYYYTLGVPQNAENLYTFYSINDQERFHLIRFK